MTELTKEEMELKEKAHDLIRRLETVSSKDAITVKRLLKQLAEYHRRMDQLKEA